jgi:hypothetical protein
VSRDGAKVERIAPGSEDAEAKAILNGSSEIIQEISASGMFALDAHPDVEDSEKLQYVYNALGHNSASMGIGEGRSEASVEVRRGTTSEPYILVSRGDDFADSDDVWFYAKAFPTLFPFGGGGPRQVEEMVLGVVGGLTAEVSLGGEATAGSALSSRNLGLETWARVVLQRHGGRFATHRMFAFLLFNKLVRFRNHHVSMMSVSRKEFPEVERIVQSLSA